MISRLAEKAVIVFSRERLISRDDEELYLYGFFMFFSQAFFLLISILFGVLFGVFPEAILFYFLFVIIRRYAGGIHAKKETVCTISTTAAILLSIVKIRVFIELSLVVIPIILLVCGIIVVVILSPLDTEAKRLTEAEKREYKKKSCICALLVGVIGVVAFWAGSSILYSCSVSLFLEAILLILGRINQHA